MKRIQDSRRSPGNLIARGAFRVLGRTTDGFEPRLGKAHWLIIALLVLFDIATFFRKPGPNAFFDDWVYYAVQIGGTLLCFARAYLIRDGERRAWFTLACGMAVWIAGDIYWTVAYANSSTPPSVSVADIGYLAFYPFVYAAVIMLVRARMSYTPKSVWLDGMVGGLAAASISAAVFFQPIASNTTGSLFTVIVNLAYPCADLLLLFLVIWSFALSGWRPDRSWMLLGVSLFLMSVSDTGYLFQTAKGMYVEGTPLDIGWPTAMALLGFAAWRRPKRVEALVFESWVIMVVPILFGLAALTVITGDRLWNAPSAAVLLAVAAIVSGFIRMMITFKEVRSLSESRREARTDELTSLGNRRLFYEKMNALLRKRNASKKLALLLIDLDRFKEINDSLGHQYGDRLLQQIGPRLREALRDDDIVTRLGGDEFSIILDGAPMNVAVEAAQRIRKALEVPFLLDGVPVKISASIGIAMFPDHANDTNQLLRHADVAMYSAKEERAQHRIYEPDHDNNTRARLNTINELRNALDEGRLVVYYQPKLNRDNTLAGAEALVRLKDATGSIVPPDQFLPLAEQAGLMQALTDNVLHIVLTDIAKWAKDGLNVKVAVNLSVTNLLDNEFPTRVAHALQEHRLAGKCLAFEITETTVLTDPERARVAVDRLRSLGGEISLDDYGTGYASIAYLRQMPLHELKLDRSFVNNLESDHVAQSFFTSTVTLAHALGLRVVAEGIETESMWDAVREAGCDVGQGYLFSKPLPSEDFFTKVTLGPLASESVSMNRG